MAEQLTAANTNLAGNFNTIVNEISQFNGTNRTQVQALIANATNYLNQINLFQCLSLKFL